MLTRPDYEVISMMDGRLALLSGTAFVGVVVAGFLAGGKHTGLPSFTGPSVPNTVAEAAAPASSAAADIPVVAVRGRGDDGHESHDGRLSRARGGQKESHEGEADD